MERVMEMEKRLVEMEEAIQKNPSYIHKLMGPVDEDMLPQPTASTSAM
jgi:hypothetical protein